MTNSPKLKAMRVGGRKLALIKNKLTAAIKPGIFLSELETLANKLILKSGGTPGFKLVPGYNWATCINLNQGVVHGIPHKIAIKAGDLVSLDIGLYFQGFHTDTSTTKVAGKATVKQLKFLSIGKKALTQAISQAKSGNHVGHISIAIQKQIEGAGLNCIQGLTGHGIGKKLHQFPPVPCRLQGEINTTPPLTQGMTVAIEVMYTKGSGKIQKLADDWTLVTAENAPAAIFEETVIINKNGPEILTRI